jgi:hypothetical protein
MAFHSLGLGSVFSPMHIPVLLCGLICGGFYGGFCGIAGPVLSSLISGMPTATALAFMVPELLTYGIAAGLFLRLIRTGKPHLDLYIALVGAMVLGRIMGGIARAIFVHFMASGQTFTITMWATSYFATALPGIIAHLIIIPVLVTTLVKARVIPDRQLKTV